MFESTGTPSPADRRAHDLGPVLPPVQLPSPALRIIRGRSWRGAAVPAPRSTVGFVPTQRRHA